MAGRFLAAVVAAALMGAVEGGLDNLLPIINKLQDVTAVVSDRQHQQAIELPQIVVVGSQSSGKSSVLESIVGRDFLPRGSGIVTRAPLILQLQTTPSNVRDGCTEWGEFLHCPKKKFVDFKDIRTEIEEETRRMVGINKKQAITNSPIRLRITSPRVPNLTMVDLPGMTKVPVGDQPKDIENQIRDLLLQYIANPNAIILAVTPANSDIATSDAIQLSRAVDPKGDRTVGVLTKVDLMDKGTHAGDMLMGRVVSLKLGFVGVINRSQKDIHDDKAMEDARADEIKFFREHPAYSHFAASGKIGTAYLAKRLNQILVMHIKTRLPALRNRLSGLLNQQRKELRCCTFIFLLIFFFLVFPLPALRNRLSGLLNPQRKERRRGPCYPSPPRAPQREGAVERCYRSSSQLPSPLARSTALLSLELSFALICLRHLHA
jgi:dynamin 1-like protein